MNNHYKNRILLVILLLISLSLACSRFAKGQADTNRPEPIPVTTEAAMQLEDNIEAVASAAISGKPFSLQLTEAQLTSSANLELQALPDNQIDNIQIYLQDGQIDFFADYTQNSFTIPINITLSVFVNGAGQIGYEIITAKMGPLSIPDSIVNQITDQIDQYLLTDLSPASTGILVSSITIADGMITINGQQP